VYMTVHCSEDTYAKVKCKFATEPKIDLKAIVAK
jgi:hypothetical protein